MRFDSDRTLEQIRLDGIAKSYEGRRGPVSVLTDVNLTVRPGELTVVSGPSGSGKTTMMLVAAGLLAPSGGHVFWGRNDIAGLPDTTLSVLRASSIGVTLQNADLVETLTAIENVALPALIAGDGDALELAREMLDAVLPADKWGLLPREMSGGERRRAALARSLVAGRRFVLADEPTADLDTASGGRVIDALVAAAGRGVGVLVMSHDRLVAECTTLRYSLSGGCVEGEG